MKRLFRFILPAVLLFTSCNLGGNKIRGNGNVKTENRATGSFSSVDVSGNIQVYVKQDSSHQVRIETDENLMEYIIIKTEGDQLVIKTKDHTNLSGSAGIKIYVSSPVFRKLEASGASAITSENLLSGESLVIDLNGASAAKVDVRSPKVSAEASGASKVFLKGQTKDLSIKASGASQAYCFELSAENVVVDVSGASSAEIFASVKLTAEASGASHVKYKGVANYSGSASGAGGISKVD